MPISRDPSVPEFLLFLCILFAVPLISVTATFIGAIRLSCQERSLPWVSAAIAILGGIPGGLVFICGIINGNKPGEAEALIQAGPLFIASLLLAGCAFLRKQRPRDRTV